jgi:adenylate cyclase
MPAIGRAYLMAGHFEEAIKWTSRSLGEWPAFAPALRFHTVYLVKLGRLSEARDKVANLPQPEPGLTISNARRRTHIFDAELMNAYLAGLRETGLPD